MSCFFDLQPRSFEARFVFGRLGVQARFRLFHRLHEMAQHRPRFAHRDDLHIVRLDPARVARAVFVDGQNHPVPIVFAIDGFEHRAGIDFFDDVAQ